jgi:hypothetical protein
MFEVEVFWFVTPCTVAVGYQRFGGPCCLHLYSEDGGSMDHLHPGLPSVIFPSDLPTKVVYAFLIFTMHATYSAHLIFLV